MDRVIGFLAAVVGIWFAVAVISGSTPIIIGTGVGSFTAGNEASKNVFNVDVGEIFANIFGAFRVKSQPVVVQQPRPVATYPPIQTGSSQRPNPAPPVVVQPSAPPVNTGAACGSRIDDRSPIVGQYWRITGSGWRILEFWTNEPGKDQQSQKLLLAPGENPEILGGGALWSFCNEADAKANFANNRFQTITLGQLKTQGLAR